MSSKLQNPVKLAGRIDWVNRDETQGEVSVHRAFFRSKDKVVLECTHGGSRYTIYLQRKTENEFEGHFNKDGQSSYGTANCKLYSSGKSYFLFGTWIEDGDDYDWWAQLEVVRSFPDEVTTRD